MRFATESHHDRAYQWAERRKLETHPKTGAAQWVETREIVEEFQPARPSNLYASTPGASKLRTPLFSHLTDDQLLGYAVPAEWLAEVRASDEDTLLLLADHLP